MLGRQFLLILLCRIVELLVILRPNMNGLFARIQVARACFFVAKGWLAFGFRSTLCLPLRLLSLLSKAIALAT